MLLSYLLIVALFASIGAVITLNTMKMSDLQTTAIKQVEIGNYAAVYQKGVDLQKAAFLEYYVGDGNNQATDQATAQAMVSGTEAYLLANIPPGNTLHDQFDICYSIMHNTIDPATNQAKSPTTYLQIRDAYAQINGNLTNFQVTALESAESANKQSQDYANFSVLISAVGITTIAVVSIVMALTFGKRLTDPLKNLTTIAGKVSMGELDHEIKINTKDEISDLGEAFQRMINAFKMTTAINPKCLLNNNV